ncbi:transcription factor bHLH57-like isoform X1 [Prosopis cineraria]|uniref:transcription factor bHLH57-like isoform X1 n=1 Tax=Prosopis cineraria TaxID=364024 RepID=UPI00240FDFDD|nr:transcription factor bHLH57-like isoform X1 [Prosopis cineraria]
MERPQGPINSCLFGEHLVPNCFEQGLIENEDEEELLMSLSSLDDKMPFLEMLQNVESQTPQLFPFKDSYFQFQTLVNQKKPCAKEERERVSVPRAIETQVHAPPELESCVTHETAEMPSQSLEKSENCRRKRKRHVKSREDVENQRMTHITVERNRRRQMNDHLGVLRSLMPPPYIQKGDQASIIGGAIDFVKELEQLLQSLEAQKRMRRNNEIGFSYGTTSSVEESNFGEEVQAESKSEFAEIEVTVIQNHVNLKVQCKRRSGQLVKAIVGLEDLRLTILHLNITSSSRASVLYCFNLKIQEECKVVTASEIAGAVEEMFRFINGS